MKFIKSPDDGYHQLACAILYEAMDSWRKHGTINAARAEKIVARHHYTAPARRCQLAEELGFDSPRQEMLDFFRGDWFRSLCDYADVPAEAILLRLAIGGG